MWQVTKGKCQKDQIRGLAHLVEHTGSTVGQMCCLVGACACQDVVGGQVAMPDRNLGQKLCVSHSDACDCAPNLLEWTLLKGQTEHPHHCCVVSQDGVWGVAGRVKGPGTFASDTDVGHLLDSRSAGAAVYGANLHQHPHVLKDSRDLRDVLTQQHDLLDHYTLHYTEAMVVLN
jgi:hypothetical protein